MCKLLRLQTAFDPRNRRGQVSELEQPAHLFIVIKQSHVSPTLFMLVIGRFIRLTIAFFACVAKSSEMPSPTARFRIFRPHFMSQLQMCHPQKESDFPSKGFLAPLVRASPPSGDILFAET